MEYGRNTMKRIYLIRHGQSEWNVEGKVQGTKDSLLTDKGREQAAMAGRRLADLEIKKIYCSGLSRARETAEIIGGIIGAEVEVIPEFVEICFGHWEGLPLDEVKRIYGEEYSVWKKTPHEFKADGCETLLEAKQRMMRGMGRIADEDENILIVSHGSSIKALMLGLLDIDLSNYKNFTLSNTGLSLIENGDYNTIMRYFNDTCHLRQEI